MKALRNYLDKIKPNFEEGGKFHAFRSVFDGFETFLFVPNATSKSGTHIHDSIDSKRIMSMVVIALVPALLFGMYNVGYQHFHATGAAGGFWENTSLAKITENAVATARIHNGQSTGTIIGIKIPETKKPS